VNIRPWPAALLSLYTGGAFAADAYPNKPIRFVIPVAAGSSSNDILGRALGQRLADGLAQQVVVDNRPGASGNIGSAIVAKSPPDGYTIMLAFSSAQVISPNVFRDIGYDPVKDLAPIAQFCVVPYVLVVNPAVPARNVKELIALAKSKPGQINFASSGIGSTPHLTAELFRLASDISIVHVPYKSGALAATDILGGHVQMYFSGITSMVPFIKTGKLRALAVTTLVRSSLMTDIPTAAESGLPGFEASSWLGIMAAARTPAPIITRLYDEVAKAVNSPDLKAFLLSQGAEPALLDPATFGAAIKAELPKWARVVKAAQIKPE
jgi:tripartite-type tricarboxylate transporter receptor subunit TctC